MIGVEKKKVVLCRVSPNFRDSKYKASFKSLALGLYCIRNYCLTNPVIAENYDVEVKAYHINADTEEIVNGIVEADPFIVGFSSYLVDYLKTVEVAAEVKRRLPGVIIAAGGPQFFDAEEELRRHDFLDVVVPFEGELTFEDLLISYLEGRSLETVAGLAFRDEAGIHYTGERRELLDLNKIPPIHSDEFLAGLTDTVVLQTSRGCSHACGYCAYAYDKYREISMDIVLGELSKIVDRPDIIHIVFADLDLAYDVDRFNELLDFFISRNGKRKVKIEIDGFWCSLPKIADSLIKMRGAGFRSEFDISLQSVSDGVLKISHRKWLSFKQIIEIVPKVLWYFPRASVELILGLPGETPESFKNDHLALFENGIRGFNVFELMILPGSEFYRKRDELGLVWRDNVTYTLKHSRDFSERQMEEAKSFSTNFQILAWALHPEDLGLYKEWGIDLVSTASRMTTLKEHCDAKYNMGIVASEVRETAIDALTDFLHKECGFDVEKIKMINEYLHFKYKISGFLMDTVREEFEGLVPDPPPVMHRYLKLCAGPGIISLLDIKQVSGKGTPDPSGNINVIAIYVPQTRKAILTESGNEELFRKLREAAASSKTVQEMLLVFNKTEKPSALAMIVRLVEIGALPKTLYIEFYDIHKIFSVILKQSDFNLLNNLGIEIADISSILPEGAKQDVAAQGENALNKIMLFVEQEYSGDPGRLEKLKAYLNVKFRTYVYENETRAKLRERDTVSEKGLIAGYKRFDLNRDILEMLNISEKRVEIGADGKAAVFAIYNPVYDMAVFLSGKNNTMLEKLLEAACMKNSIDEALEIAGEYPEARMILTRMEESGFFKTS